MTNETLSPRTLLSCLLLTVATVLLGTGTSFARDLTFEERVGAQEAIERIYYSHQIGATKPFEEAVPREVLENKVRTYLKESAALEQIWHTPVTAEALQRELNRIARQTRLPERLQEIYGVLDNDPFLILECFARRSLVDRLMRDFFASDSRIHGAVRAEAEALRQHLQTEESGIWRTDPHRTVADLVNADEPDADDWLSVDPPLSHGGSHGVPRRRMSPEELERLRTRIPGSPGEIGQVIEERDALIFHVTLATRPDRIRVATYAFPKTSWAEWWTQTQDLLDEGSVMAVASPTGVLPPVQADPEATRSPCDSLPAAAPESSLSACPKDVWDSGSLSVPTRRAAQASVWTGTVLVVWGGYDGSRSTNSGGRYDPLTDTWMLTSVLNAPSPRTRSTAVWTGEVALVWGGYDGSGFVNTGGRYDPANDTWAPISNAHAPAGCSNHSALWTGSLMVVWGGDGNSAPLLSTGGRYDPALDAWTATSTAGAPSRRRGHTAVWTGSEMVVWGGTGYGGSPLNTGARYDPEGDSWTPTAPLNAPTGRAGHTAVWTGREMIVWGGDANSIVRLNTGARYEPRSDTWAPTTTTGAPTGRYAHSAVWTGNQMIIWGGIEGSDQFPGSGGRYDPASDLWTTTALINAPEGRRSQAAAWTGELLIVWGGSTYAAGRNFWLNSGGRYDPSTDTWTPTRVSDAPSGRDAHTAIWTGNVMIVWGGWADYPLNTGARYDPLIDTWTPVSTAGAPSIRELHTAVWTGSVMVVWGGLFDNFGSYTYLNTGGRYDPTNDAWAPTSLENAPTPRYRHTGIWTGREMVVWGGFNGVSRYLSSGGRYDPATDRWTSVSTQSAPDGRSSQAAVWTGTAMIVWGGLGFGPTGSPASKNTGGSYDPATDTWTPTSTFGAPSDRYRLGTVWTGSAMVVWGGLSLNDTFSYPQDGGRYDPAQDAWAPLSALDAPLARYNHTTLWTGSEMLVWGGWNAGQYLNTGGRYDPANDAWRPTATANAPEPRSVHTAVWIGDSMIIWGGDAGPSTFLGTGGRYAPHCLPPKAVAVAPSRAECVSPTGAPVVLDGSASSDLDSTPGTNDDIISFQWLLDAGNSDPVLLGNGEIVSVNLPLGSNRVTLRVTDIDGRTDSAPLTIAVVDTTPPILSCPTEVTAECTSPAGAQINLLAEASDACSAAVYVENDRTAAGADASGDYPLGRTDLTFTARDTAGNQATCSGVVNVRDTTPPQVASTVAPSLLWPPNHRMVDVGASVVATDACSTPTVILASVASSEPDDAFGEGDATTTDDIQGAEIGTADFDFRFRAERDGTGEGRVYEVTHWAIDGSGNRASAVSFVLVPHDQGKGVQYQWNWNNRYRINP